MLAFFGLYGFQPGFCQNRRHVTQLLFTHYKGAVLQDFIISNNIDVLVLNEMWLLRDNPNIMLYSMAPPGYVVTHVHQI